jgi:uncharacterized protein
MGANVRACALCGKLFNSLGRNICPQCTIRIDECFDLLRDYLYDHSHADIYELTTETGVEDKIIFMLLREGRLSLGEASDFLVCEKCGARITTGRYCKHCTKFLENTLHKACIPQNREIENPQAQHQASDPNGDWNSHALKSR